MDYFPVMKETLQKVACYCGTRAVLGSLIVTLAASLFVTWPLAYYFNSGIPASQRPEQGGARQMIPGDHLQLMYNFQLMADFVSGKTPWFHNLYEFNEGDDSARYERGSYYAPFSLFFALGAAVGGLAFGWNFAGFVSLWLGAWGTWLLVRRFTKSVPVIIAATLAGVVFPYRLITFLHGSPTGFAMAYVPFILLGLDMAVRDKRMIGGLIGGVFLFLSGWVDSHTLFFSVLLTPFWCLFVFLYDGLEISPKRIGKIALALSPCAVIAAVVALQATLLKRELQETIVSTGRSLHEVLLYSPLPSGLLGLNPDNPHNLIYITVAITAMVAAGLLIMLWRIANKVSAETSLLHFLLYIGLLCGVLIIMLLSLGPRMPVHAADVWWDRICRVIPPYGMIRQPAKVFSILPALLSVLIVLPFAGWRPRKTSTVLWITTLFSLFLLAEATYRIRPKICLLDKEQGAYAAVVENAQRHGVAARAVAVVLWPGDTHWSSLYEYYGKKYRIRMLNGYKPHVSNEYKENIFFRFESLNHGYANDEQLADLLARGINHVLLHEDAFPEKVSPFGVAQTLERFMRDPRFRFMTRDRSVWAFEIMPESDDANIIEIDWETASPTRIWDGSRCRLTDAVIVEGHDDVFVGVYVALGSPASSVELPMTHLFFRDGLRLMLRVRGEGIMRADMSLPDGGKAFVDVEVASADWHWIAVPYPAFEGFGRVETTLRLRSGLADFDYAYIAVGLDPVELQAGQSFAIPPPVLFRAGYTDLENDTVILQPESVPADKVLYGPRLPLPVGDYELRVSYSVDGYDGAIGSIGFRYPGESANPERIDLPGNQERMVIPFRQTSNMSMTFDFNYNRKAAVEFSEFEIVRQR